MQSRRWVDLEPGVAWAGDVDEFVSLLGCVGAHCTCRSGEYLSRGARTCPSHQLLGDQQVLDHLVFARRMRERLVRSEWSLDDAPRAEQTMRRRSWRPNALAYAVAALVLMLGLSGTLPSLGSQPHAPIATWQDR
jgi:hypothetical protein